MCSDFLHHIWRNQGEDESFKEYISSLCELIECIKVIYRKWTEYQTILESSMESQSTLLYQAHEPQLSSGPGRPKFQIFKDLLEYLSSFKWNEVAALVGVSRMTTYRYSMYMWGAGGGGRRLARDSHVYASFDTCDQDQYSLGIFLSKLDHRNELGSLTKARNQL